MIRYKSWAIPEGNVVKVTDESGAVIWAVKSGSKAVLQVAKQTLDTYAGETTYTGESFVAIDVYPKTNGTVKVTYGGLTKTIKDTSGAENPNAQLVYFGTLYGVSDSVTTPASGELTIEGDFNAFGCGGYCESAKNVNLGTYVYCGCITAVNDWGEVTTIPSNAFYNCSSLALTSLPSGITSIGSYAFYKCSSITLTSLPSGITSIGGYAFQYCNGLTSVVVPEGVVSVGTGAFNGCDKLANLTLPATLQTIGDSVAHKLDISGAVGITLRVLATTPPTCQSENPHLVQKLGGLGAENVIIVPKGCLSAYKSAYGWSEYAEVANNVNLVVMKEAS